MEFPVRSDYFPQVRLTNEDKAKYLRTVESSVRALRRGLDEFNWKKVYDKEGVTYSKVQERGSAGTCLAVCATIYTSGTISEVLEAIASPVTDDYRKAMKFLYKSRFVDGVALHTIAPSATQNPQAFTTIKWAAFDDGKGFNNPKFPVGSDYCFLEHAGIQKDELGADSSSSSDESNAIFGFCVQESILREREVSSLAGYGLRRGEFHRTGVIILPTDRRDVVQVSSILQMRLLGSDSTANKAALEKLMLKRVASVGRVDLLLERRRLNKMQFVARDEWVADETRKSCVVCVKPFGIRRRHHCRNCGEVVCSTCAPPREVDIATYGTALVRVCTACVVAARSEPQQLLRGDGAAQDVFVYHIRSTLSSRTSTDSSHVTNEDHDQENDDEYPPNEDTFRPHSVSSDSNFSIASEYQQQPSITESSSQITYHIDDPSDHFNGGYGDYGRGSSVSSSNSSSYSFSDLNTFDDRFGLVALKRLAPAPPPLPLRKDSNSNSMLALYRPPVVRSVYNPKKVVMTHLLMNDSNQDDEHKAKAVVVTSDKRSSVESLPDFEESLRGITADLSRVTTYQSRNTRFNDLQTANDSFDLTSFTNDLFSSNSSIAPSAAPATASKPVSLLTSHAQQRSESVCSRPSNVDVDMFTSDSFSLICSDTLQQQQRRSSVVQQDAGEQQLRSTKRTVSIGSRYSQYSNTGNDDEHENGDDSMPQSHEELEMLRRHVEGLHRSLEHATSKLQLYEARSQSRSRGVSVESEAVSESAMRRSSSSVSSARGNRLSRHGSGYAGNRKWGGDHGDSIALVNRNATFDALVAELHEIMGLPALPSAAAASQSQAA
ncbi:Lysosomal trafficking regulator, partial [Globisporangium splendens]